MDPQLKLQKTIGGIEFYGYFPNDFATEDWQCQVRTDGFLGKDPGHLYITFTGAGCEKYSALFTGQKINSLQIMGYGEDRPFQYDFSALNLEELTHLSIEAKKTAQIIISPKQNTDNLKYLSMTHQVPRGFLELPILFSKLDYLRVWADNAPAVQLLKACTGIKDSWISHFKANDLHVLAQHQPLQRLCVSQSAIKSLDGLSSLPNLETLHIVATKNLTDVSDMLAAPKLKNIMFSKYRKITNWDFLADKKDWQVIWLEQAENIDFINQLPDLKSFYCAKLLNADKNAQPDFRFRLKDSPVKSPFYYEL